MGVQGTDIFSSDQQFLAATSTFAIIVGLLGLTLVLGCKVLGLAICDLDWVPLFGGFDVFRTDLAAINLPLALLIMGVGLRLYTPFGWITCQILLLLLGTGFTLLAWQLNAELSTYWQQVAEQPLLAERHPVVESIVVNTCFALLSALLFIYLLLPGPRKLFWTKEEEPVNP